jgi:hypothetical protein
MEASIIKRGLGAMGTIEEKAIRAYQLKKNTYVCPVCATDEEKADDTVNIVAEDEIHDEGKYCLRCKKKLT